MSPEKPSGRDHDSIEEIVDHITGKQSKDARRLSELEQRTVRIDADNILRGYRDTLLKRQKKGEKLPPWHKDEIRNITQIFGPHKTPLRTRLTDTWQFILGLARSII